MTITVSSIDGQFVPNVTQTITSGVSYFYEAIFTRDNVYTVIFSDETNADGVLFIPVKINICKVTDLNNQAGGVVATVEGKVNAMFNSPVSVDIPKFIRQISLETVNIFETGDFSIQILFRKESISSKKQIIHAG